MTTSAGNSAVPPRSSRLSVDELVRAKQVRPIRSVADVEAMAADVFESDEELDRFLEFTHAERHHDVG